MNFKEYMNMIEGRRIDEATMSLQDMLDNFRKFFLIPIKKHMFQTFMSIAKTKIL